MSSLGHAHYAVAAPRIRRIPVPPAATGRGPVHPTLQLQHLAGNRALGHLQAKLMVNRPGDQYEVEAESVADQVMRMPEPRLQRTCACGGACSHCQDGEFERLQTKRSGSGDLGQTPVPAVVHQVLRSRGQPLDPATRAFMEPRVGHDFSGVRVHTDPLAARSAAAVGAHAYTVGSDVVFAAGRYAPAHREGQRLLAHELTHVVQQSRSLAPASLVQRDLDDADLAAERAYGDSGAPKAQTCGGPSHCPAGFCSPYRSEQLAEYYRAKKGGLLLTGISAAVDSRVVPFWREYLSGGSDPKNITADFGKDFTKSPTTKKTTAFLHDELKKSIAAKPPSVALNSTTSVDLGTQIPKAVAALGDPVSPNQMNFSVPRDIPGNLAGGIGMDQLACPAGAKPSPFNDERHASGTVAVTRLSASELTVSPVITYTVKDTVDLCPGDCGTTLEQVATIPLSQFEATGISGDVPFTVDFPAPSLGSFKVPAPAPTTPAPAPSPKKP